MKISDLEIHVLKSPLAESFAFSQGWVRQRSATLVEVITDAGLTGWGGAFRTRVQHCATGFCRIKEKGEARPVHAFGPGARPNSRIHEVPVVSEQEIPGAALKEFHHSRSTPAAAQV